MDNEKVLYFCDGKACPSCSDLCNHTTDINHAVNFTKKGDCFIEDAPLFENEFIELHKNGQPRMFNLSGISFVEPVINDYVAIAGENINKSRISYNGITSVVDETYEELKKLLMGGRR